MRREHRAGRLLPDAARERQRGATAVEYGLLVALIAAVCITTVGLLGDKLSDLYDSVHWW